MRHRLISISISIAAALAAPTGGADVPLVADPPIDCADCAAWNEPHEPFRVFGDTYYVGTAGLSAILVTSDDGHVLIDGGLPQSAPLVAANVAELGFELADVRLILNSHAHYDHAGGIAALQRASGATVAATADSARALGQGGPLADDPQFAFGPRETGFPAVPGVRIVADGETLRVGEIALVAHATPGHTTGGTTWTWVACEGERCLDVVYADSLTAVSAPGFRFAAPDGGGAAAALRGSIATVAALPCDVLLAPHPGFLQLAEKLERRRSDPESEPFVDPEGCRAYAATAGRGLDRRLAEEAAAAAP